MITSRNRSFEDVTFYFVQKDVILFSQDSFFFSFVFRNPRLHLTFTLKTVHIQLYFQERYTGIVNIDLEIV